MRLLLPSGYRISKSIPDICVFAVQNVTRDPPFSRLDLISCRNLLIYLGPVLQKRIMRVFHYALKSEGFLLLGSAESIGEHSDLFRALDAKEKVYAKKPVALPLQMEFGTPAAIPPMPGKHHYQRGGTQPPAKTEPVNFEGRPPLDVPLRSRRRGDQRAHGDSPVPRTYRTLS